MSDNVISLADRANNSAFQSVEQMLEEALREVRAGELKGTKAILLVLDPGDGDSYTTRYRCAKMRASEVIALLTVNVAKFVDMVRGLS